MNRARVPTHPRKISSNHRAGIWKVRNVVSKSSQLNSLSTRAGVLFLDLTYKNPHMSVALPLRSREFSENGPKNIVLRTAKEKGPTSTHEGIRGSTVTVRYGEELTMRAGGDLVVIERVQGQRSK